MRSTSSIRRVAATMLVALALVACAERGEPQAPGGETVDVSAKDSGGTVSLSTGDELVVTLESNVTTGFAWKLTTEPDAAVLDLAGSRYVEPTTGMVGAGGTEVWRFVATGPGTTDLEMRYQRPWSGETAGDPFSLTVDVSG